MRRHEEVRRQFVRQWLDKATADLGASGVLLRAGSSHPTAAAFHAQQAAEKLLKALLVWHQIAFPKTHDLGRLVDLLATADLDLAEMVRDATALSPYGADVRYPGDLPEPSVTEAEEAVVLARRIRDVVVQHLPPTLTSGA